MHRLAIANLQNTTGIAPLGRELLVLLWERIMTLREAEEGKEYIIVGIETDDEELNAFLFSLGCYSGEPITVISRRRSSCVVSIKDGRYNIDNDLADAIRI